MESNENYIKQIKAVLDKTGWSQSRFASNIGVSFATVNRWLNQHTKPHPGQLRQIKKVFKNIVGVAALSDQAIGKMLGKVEAKKRQFSNIRKLLRRQDVIEEFLLELTYNSDAIEGSTLTKKETEAIIFDKASINDKSLTDHLEAINHSAILVDIFSGRLCAPIDENLIKNIHKMLMQGIRSDAGQYAKYPRGIRGVDLALPHPKDISDELNFFLQKVNSHKAHPIVHAARMHADFETIHPFGDGNGRVGRLIMIIQLINSGFAPCLISANEKAGYYECLEFAQKKSETHLTNFIAEAVLAGYRIIEKIC
ncbi:MAG: helix-turn-helix domain-containing protein [Candidatus Omnitrophica bacterium]|nr:helix-turn-helix domain-containing protein [Candidatus Omnitrophota bacterium]